MTWRATVDEWGRCTMLEVDGLPVAVPAGVQLVAVPGQPPALTLYLADGVEIEGSTTIVAETAGSPRGAVLAWLASLDPNTIEKSALDAMGMMGAQSTGEAFIIALRADAETLT